MLAGAKALGMTAVDVLTEAGLTDRMWKEFRGS